MQRVNVEEVTRRLPDLIDAALRGEVILIAANDHQTVRLIPVRQTRKPRRLGSAKGMIHMADDFDAPLEDFQRLYGVNVLPDTTD
ncbi:MAG: prevent-host-death protein [Roseiflexus castenholzii]|uniref:type II toxin-antitoxin system Phd/YefM family antitoxin n=1 Tax=Roseiflexus castenholzii TaxID=120962 RepID=UPI000CA9BA55|nr:MAG: prevent-host-death protein [Roseiflexus castenholzii]